MWKYILDFKVSSAYQPTPYLKLGNSIQFEYIEYAFLGNELDNYARAQRSFHEINEYTRMQRDLDAYARAQRAATNVGNGNEDENGIELGSPEDQIDNMELNNQNDLIRELHER